MSNVGASLDTATSEESPESIGNGSGIKWDYIF